MKEFFQLLKRFVPPYKWYLALNIFFNFLGTALSLFSFAVIIPVLQILFRINETAYTFMAWDGAGKMQDKLLNNAYYYITSVVENQGAPWALGLLGIVLIIMTFLKTGASWMASFYIIPIRTGIVRDIRNLVFDKVLSLPIGFFSSERKGDIMARMTGDVAEVENSITSSLDMIFKNPIMIIIYLTTMFTLSWQLTIFVLILLPISGYIMGIIGKQLKKSSFQAQTMWGGLMAQIDETLGGLRVIKAFNAEQKIVGRFKNHNDEMTRLNNRIARRQSLAHPMSEFLGTSTIALVLCYGGMLIINNNSSIDAASFIYYLIIFYSIINPAKDLTKAAYNIQRGLSAMERVDLIMGAENPIKAPKEPVNIEEFQHSIEFKNVSFKYADAWVLRNVSLTIPKGKTVALVGQSGSGKSTLVDLIPRFYDVVEGSILVDGVDVRQMSPKRLRSLMGNVNQEAILFNDTFRNNISFGVENATAEQVEMAAKIANAHDFISATDHQYDSNIGDRGCKLSGGQRQRVSIARAVLKNPPILILDEATSALDTESERLVQDALEKLMRNRTSVVIAHRLSTIKNADLICVMQDGEIVERGSHDELIAHDGVYKKLVDMQSF